MIAATTIRILLRSIAEALPLQWRSPCGPWIPDCYSGPGSDARAPRCSPTRPPVPVHGKLCPIVHPSAAQTATHDPVVTPEVVHSDYLSGMSFLHTQVPKCAV